MRRRASNRGRETIIVGGLELTTTRKLRLGNKISALRYNSWKWRKPRTDPLERELADQASLHPEWVDRLLLKLQDWLWK